jgi:hypothetical protein
MLDRLFDARRPVPEKLERLLARRPDWCTGQGLHAIAGQSLLNPLEPEAAAELLTMRGAQVDIRDARAGSALLIARPTA